MKKKLAIIGAICFVAFVVFGIIWINKGDKMVQLTEYGKQVAFLEDHKKEMMEFIKSQNPKIESVQLVESSDKLNISMTKKDGKWDIKMKNVDGSQNEYLLESYIGHVMDY